MTATELAAYIGAAAWLPQMFTWLYRWLAVPVLTIVPERVAEIGFTAYGPIFNLRMAFSSDRKDLTVSGFDLELVHEDGEKRLFRWSGMREDLGETRDSAGVQQGQWTKDQVPIALKVGTVLLVERFVRFQEPRYEETVGPLTQNLVASFNFLKRTDPDYVSKTLLSREFVNLTDGRQKQFWWKAGRYQLTFKPASSRRFAVRDATYRLELSQLDVDSLRKNVDAIKKDLENTVNSNLPDFTAVEVSWNWAYGRLIRVEKGRLFGVLPQRKFLKS